MRSTATDGRRSRISLRPSANGTFNVPIGGLLPVLAFVTLGFLQLPVKKSFAQDRMGETIAQEDDAPLDMSRDQWRERVGAAKRRAQRFALEQRGRATFYASPLADEERLASDRVLDDDSLQFGDIVSTNKGLFIFKGRPDRERSNSDFVPLSAR
jgi:hypothetical protein